MRILLLYLPVPHRGYREFLRKHTYAVDYVCLLDQSLIDEFPHLRKNVPAISPTEARSAIVAMEWVGSSKVVCVTKQTLERFNDSRVTVITPDEDIVKQVVSNYLDNCQVIYDPVFLRWDMQASTNKHDLTPTCKISHDAFDQEVMGMLNEEKGKSLDFWRQVAAAIVIDKQIVCFAHNIHTPDPESPYFYGDPRFNFSRGIGIETSTAIHAEAQLIAHCAKDNTICTNGASIYVTTFPCPPCSALIVAAGFSKCYFREGYSLLNAELNFTAAYIEIIQVE